MNEINEELEQFHNELLAEGLGPSTPEVSSELKKKYAVCVQRVRNSAHERHNVSEDVIHAAAIKYQTDPHFQLMLAQISKDHRNRLSKLGFDS